MKLLCCADTHGRQLPAKDETTSIAWLHAGDVENGPDVDRHASDIDPRTDPLLAPVADWFETRSTPVYAVRGNHDCTDAFGAFQSGRDVTGRVVPLAPKLWLAGIGWHGDRYFDLPRESDLESVCHDIARQARRLVLANDNVVVLTHYPPKAGDFRDARDHPGESGIWYRCIRELVSELKPVLVIEGHNHRWANTSYEIKHPCGQSTFVLNPGRTGSVVELDLESRSAWLAE